VLFMVGEDANKFRMVRQTTSPGRNKTPMLGLDAAELAYKKSSRLQMIRYLLHLNSRSTGFMRPVVLPLFISAAAVWMSAASLSISAASLAQEPDSTIIAAQIRSVLQTQQEAWNRGDVNGFMNGYARSKSIIFVSEDTVTRGWETVHDHYQKKYSDRAKMGVLTFSSVEITPLSNDAAVVLGRWKLKRAQDQPHDRFTLIFRKTTDGLQIVHDHTSAAPLQK